MSVARFGRPFDGGTVSSLPPEFYSDTERNDAIRLDELLAGTEQGPLSDQVREKLQEIAVRSPKPGDYEARRQVGDTLYIKAWPNEEPWYRYAYEEKHLDESVATVVCVPSAYPVVWLILARELDASGDAVEGRKFAEVSLSIEEHPASLCEVGAMVGAEGQHELALGLFSRAFELREDIAPWFRARAALGVGVTLLEDGQLDKAEEAIRLSLQFDPESQVAAHALTYVEEARAEAAASGEDPTSAESETDAPEG